MLTLFPNSSELKPKRILLLLQQNIPWEDMALGLRCFKRCQEPLMSFLSYKKIGVLLPKEENMLLDCHKITNIHFSYFNIHSMLG